jgi:threonine dehydrogenase-like Zn-dependent dehydrogenase
MRAAVCGGPGQLAIEELPVPEPGQGEVRVRMRACGICGSDLHLFPLGYLGQRVIPGHEMMGEVDALGAGVEGLAPGDTVAIEPLSSCGRCATCREGRDSICRDCQLFGIHHDGGFAEYVSLPVRRLFPVSRDLAPQLAALVEPTAVMVHGLRRGRFEPGQRVLVLGAGSLGLIGTLAARALGAEEVWATARYDHQAKLASELGADRVLGEQEASLENLRKLGEEFPIDCVLETVGGSADTLRLASEAVRPGGTISVVGVFMGPVTIDPYPLLLKEGTLAWSNCYDHPHVGADFETATRLVDEHRDALARLTTHQVGLDEIDRGFRLAADRKAGAIKVTVLF